jgi:hypothetical protein
MPQAIEPTEFLVEVDAEPRGGAPDPRDDVEDG